MGELQQLAVEVGADERTLRRAVATGAVRCRRPGQRRLAISEQERAYLRQHWQLLSDLRGALRTEPNVRLAVLYGSTARGDDRPYSDVDVLVAFAEDRPDAAMALAYRLEQTTGRDVDIARLERIRERAPLLLLQAIDEGRVLVDRDQVWPRLLAQRLTIARRAERDYQHTLRQAAAALRELAGA